MKRLTERQIRVLEYVKQHQSETGYPPTRAEIAKALGFKSANAAEEHLKALHKKGALQMIRGTSRGIKLAPEWAPNAGIPIVGRVAAGNPILAQEHVEDHCELSANFFRPAADYLLRVQGDSMVDVGILDGDLLAVHSTPTADNGQIVVARVDGEVTVKRFRREGDDHMVTLLPENQSLGPIEVDLRHQEFAIEGLGVGILRH